MGVEIRVLDEADLGFRTTSTSSPAFASIWVLTASGTLAFCGTFDA